jgi:hypothetical protein
MFIAPPLQPTSSVSASSSSSSSLPFPQNTNEPFDTLDTYALDKDDRKKTTGVSDREITLGITTGIDKDGNLTTGVNPVNNTSDTSFKTSDTSFNLALSEPEMDKETRQFLDTINAVINQVKYTSEDLKRKFNWYRVCEVVGVALSIPARVFNACIRYLSDQSTKALNKSCGPKALNQDSNEYTQLKDVMNKLFSNIINILISFWIALNWWYIFAYKRGCINISEIAKTPGFDFVAETHTEFLSVVNYGLTGIKETKAFEKVAEMFWPYRTGLFIGFMMTITALVKEVRTDIETAFFKAISFQESWIGTVGAFMFIFTFLRVDFINMQRNQDRVKMYGTILTFFVIVFKLLILMIFIPVGPLLVYVYLVYQSFFGIFVSAGLHLSTEINKMAIDLGNSVPEPEGRKELLFEKAKRLIINNTLTIIVLSICVWATSENYKWTKDLNMKNEPYKVLLVIALVVMILTIFSFHYMFYKIARNVLGVDLIGMILQMFSPSQEKEPIFSEI